MVTTVILTLIVDIIIALGETLIGLRIILKLLAANPNTPFVQWIYNSSKIFLSPFLDMFPTTAVNEGSVIELSSIFALIFYAVIGKLIMELIYFIDTGLFRRKPKNKIGEHEERIF